MLDEPHAFNLLLDSAVQRFLHSSARRYPFQYKLPLRPICFLGNSIESLRDFPEEARQDVGYQLDQVQRGRQPSDFKWMLTVGKGVEELRV